MTEIKFHGSTKRPLFITRYGLSDSTAIGVQTRQLLEYFPDYLHLYWYESVLDPIFPRSHCIENRLFSRVPVLKRDSALARSLAKMKGSRWRDDKPTEALRAFLDKLRAQISAVYLAPIDALDARRMKEIATALGLPYVLHLWDFLDNAEDSTTRWLIDNAAHVFCLNGRIFDNVRKTQGKCSVMAITRTPSKVTAQYPSGGNIKISLLGQVGPYIDGVNCLTRAVQSLRKAGELYEIVYVGKRKTLKLHSLDVFEFITATGFIVSAEQRDKVLAECAVGFMPGPTAAPETNPRSKYSIPSRILDFMAIGMPIVGTVHPDSATYSFCRDLGLNTGLLLDDPERLAQALAALTDRRAWDASSQKSLSAFAKITNSHNIASLKAELGCEAGPSNAGLPRLRPTYWSAWLNHLR